MAITINEAWIKTFETNVLYVAQQVKTKLRGWARERADGTSQHSFKKVGKLDMQEKTTRRQNTPENDTPWSNRVVVPKVFDIGDTLEREDELKVALDPTSTMTQVFGMACARQFDDIIIDAAQAAALDEAGTSNAFPAGQIVQAGGASEISFNIVTEIAAKFAANDIDPEEPKIAVIGPNQARKLMHEAKATSDDFVNAKVLATTGFLSDWMGFTWVVSNRLNAPGSGRLYNIFMTKQAMGLLVPEEFNVQIAKDPSKSFMWRLYGRFMANAVRVQDEHIVLFDALNTVTIP